MNALAIGRILLIGLWVLGALGLALPGATPVWRTLGMAVVVMAMVHVVEFTVYLPTLRRVGGSLPGHFAQAFFFGLLYLAPLKKA